jgi:quinol monooxygenase YgiN
MSDTVSFVVTLSAKPETSARMRELLLDVVTAMSREPDFINTWVHEDLNDPHTVILYETWACSKEHFIEHHLGKSYRLAYEAVLPDLLAKPRTLDFMKIIASFPGKTAAAA